MIKPGDRILISGDSWGCGEWVYDAKDKSTYIAHTNGMDNYGVVHLGIEHYLREYGCIVCNVSQGGSSNIDSINRLTKQLTEFKPNKVFWFQTDPIRDLRPYSSDTFPKSVNEMIERQQQLIEKSYRRLDALGIEIHCMGGSTKLQESIQHYKNLVPLIDSIIEFFGSTALDIWVSEWIHYNRDILTDQLVDELYALPKHDLTNEWFYPDGAHPNRHAHKKIFEHILTC